MVVFVSAGLLRPKKNWSTKIGVKNHYLNYGLSGLASIAKRNGYTVAVTHGGFKDPIKFAAHVVEFYLCDSQYPLFLSLPSFYAVPWAALFCHEIKSLMPEVRIIAGGRWVVDNNSDWIQSHIPEIDVVSYGLAEDKIKSLIADCQLQHKYHSPLIKVDSSVNTNSQLSNIDYTIIENYREYTPSIEVSRGCNMGCEFCVEGKTKLTPIRIPESILSAIRHIVSVYETDTLTTYFESSFFNPDLVWTKAFKQMYMQNKLRIKWRCETRVDTLNQDVLGYLADAGLRVIDIGLESASSTQLLRMRKTRNPSEYLRRASLLLKTCHRLGIWCKVNIMLYAGETLTSIKETLEWLNEHKPYIKGVSCGPLVVYGIDSDTRNFLQSLNTFGCRPVDESAIMNEGVSNLNLSDTLDFNTTNKICLEISRKYMSARDYFDLKSFSYFPRSFSYSNFLNIVSESDPDELPFSIDSIMELDGHTYSTSCFSTCQQSGDTN